MSMINVGGNFIPPSVSSIFVTARYGKGSCALYIEESERGKSLGSRLLAHGQQEAAKLGFSMVYLCTDHVGYYEKYGWRFFGMEASEWDGDTRVYEFVVNGGAVKTRNDCVGSVYGNVYRDTDYISDLLDFIRRDYGIEATGISPANRGYYGETWKVDAKDRRYFLKLDYSTVHKFIYGRSFSVMEHLHSNGIEFISSFVKTVDGRLSTQYDGAVLGVFDWIDGDNVQNEHTIIAEYQMLNKIYTVSSEELIIQHEDFSESSVTLFFQQWSKLEDEKICAVFEEHRDIIEHRAARLKHFSGLCRNDTTGFVITHGDAGGNIIVNGDKFTIVDWDDPILAPPERDAWFCLHWSWAMDSFNNELQKSGMNYTLRPERLAYYCYHSFFFYLTEYLSTYFDIGNRGGNIAQKLDEYFGSWIEERLRFADTIP